MPPTQRPVSFTDLFQLRRESRPGSLRSHTEGDGAAGLEIATKSMGVASEENLLYSAVLYVPFQLESRTLTLRICSPIVSSVLRRHVSG